MQIVVGESAAAGGSGLAGPEDADRPRNGGGTLKISAAAGGRGVGSREVRASTSIFKGTEALAAGRQ